ncbi:MAG: TetR/AcrR family transcriptional regulator [Pseudomonas sp.]|jgi:AcrR family transcriptional regulator
MSDDASLQHRLLQTTESLIYAGGINATGMDAIVKASGVARKSIYRLYPTKEALVAAALRERDERWMQWFIAGTSAGSPGERLLAAFPLLRSWFQTPDFRGCAFINAAGEIGDPDSEIRAVTQLHKQRLLAYLQELTTACGFAEPEEMARQFLLLIDGATAVAMVTGQADAADSAGRTAQLLLQSLSSSDGQNPPQT